MVLDQATRAQKRDSRHYATQSRGSQLEQVRWQRFILQAVKSSGPLRSCHCLDSPRSRAYRKAGDVVLGIGIVDFSNNLVDGLVYRLCDDLFHLGLCWSHSERGGASCPPFRTSHRISFKGNDIISVGGQFSVLLSVTCTTKYPRVFERNTVHDASRLLHSL